MYVYLNLSKSLSLQHPHPVKQFRSRGGALSSSRQHTAPTRRFEWEHGSDDLVFLQLGVYEDEVGKNKLIVVFCVRLDSVMEGEWVVVRMINGKGRVWG